MPIWRSPHQVRMVLADGYGGHLPMIDKVPPDMQKVMYALRERPAGKYIQRIYDDHRAKSPAASHGV